MHDTIIHLGDVVRLCSGSPDMTAESFGDTDMLVCVWYEDETRQFRREAFRCDALEIQPR